MTNTPMTSREAFDEYIRDGKHIFFDDMDEAYALWQASQSQQAQTIAELVEALEDAVGNIGYISYISDDEKENDSLIIGYRVLLAKLRG